MRLTCIQCSSAPRSDTKMMGGYKSDVSGGLILEPITIYHLKFL